MDLKMTGCGGSCRAFNSLVSPQTHSSLKGLDFHFLYLEHFNHAKDRGEYIVLH